jgi:hypothetical protein
MQSIGMETANAQRGRMDIMSWYSSQTKERLLHEVDGLKQGALDPRGRHRGHSLGQARWRQDR